MPTLRYHGAPDAGPQPVPERTAIPFPRMRLTSCCSPASEMASEVFEAFEAASRRMEDLARELGCLGYFDDGVDGPRAA